MRCQWHSFATRYPPPLLRHDNPNSDWTPFTDRVQFALADLLYRKVEMSASNINELFDSWAASMERHNADGPFDSHKEMHDRINAAHFGGAPWNCLRATVDNNVGPDAPAWRTREYEVWYRNPQVVLQNMLDNPDFNGHFDYVPYVALDKSGERRWGDYMSSNYAWSQSVGPLTQRHCDSLIQGQY